MKKYYEKRGKYLSFREEQEAIFAQFSGAKANTDSYKLRDQKKAEEIVKRHLSDPFIAIVNDYDIDGMTSAAITNIGLKAAGFKGEIYIRPPKRFSEGYGLSSKITDELIRKCPGEGHLLILMDNGIAAIDPVKEMKDAGWEVLIFDHHLAAKDENGNVIYPEADLIIDPNAVPASAAFNGYCGAGLMYKFFRTMGVLKDYDLMKALSFAAIGTIGDSVPFIEERNEGDMRYDNFLIVRDGLTALHNSNGQTTGLYAAMNKLGLDYGKCTETDIAFSLCPFLNALGRLEDNGSAVVGEFIRKDDHKVTETKKTAEMLFNKNTERKNETARILPVLRKRIEESGQENDYVIVVTGYPGEIHPGLVGLLAGRLAEEYRAIVIVLSPDGDILKGSSRAPEGANIKDLLDKTNMFLETYGGHAQAAGLALKEENLDKFTEAIKKEGGEKPKSLYSVKYDFAITPDKIEKLLKEIDEFAPYGVGHESPKFRIEDYHLESRRGAKFRYMGKPDMKCVKLFNKYADAVEFSGEGKKEFRAIGCPDSVILYGELETNSWNGTVTPQIRFYGIEKGIPEFNKDKDDPAKYMESIMEQMSS